MVPRFPCNHSVGRLIKKDDFKNEVPKLFSKQFWEIGASRALVISVIRECSTVERVFGTLKQYYAMGRTQCTVFFWRSPIICARVRSLCGVTGLYRDTCIRSRKMGYAKPDLAAIRGRFLHNS